MDYERALADRENFVFDLDGTVWAWNELKDGVADTLEALRSRDKELYFLTNNSILTRDGVADKLQDMGVTVDADRVLSGAYMAAAALDREDVREVYLIGEDGLRQELAARNIAATDDADAVLVGVDRNFSYWKMADAAELVRDGATLYATAADPYWWGGDRHLPGTKALAHGILTAAGTEDVTVLGKPSKYARQVVREAWDLRPMNTVMIGDSLDTDVAFGNKMGYKTCLVLGGRSTEDDLATAEDHAKPHIVFRAFDRILMKV